MRELGLRLDNETDDEEFRSLYDWLQNEPAVRRNATLSTRREAPKQGEMGLSLDVIQLLIDSGFQLSTLVMSIVAWRSTRKKKPELTIESNGTSISFDSADDKRIIEILEALDEK